MGEQDICFVNDINRVRFVTCDDGFLSSLVLHELDQLLWDKGLVTNDDKQRWLSQGIHTAKSTFTGSSLLSTRTTAALNLDEIEASIHQWGLVQSHGGPCGVLAAIQSELLALILFGHDVSCKLYKSATVDAKVLLRIFPDSILSQPDEKRIMKRPVDSSLIHRAIATALGWILARAAMASVSSDVDADTLFLQAKVKLVLPLSFKLQHVAEVHHSNIQTSTETCSSLRCITLMLQKGQYPHSLSELDFPLDDSLNAAINSSSPENRRLDIMSLLAYCVADYLQSSQALFQFVDAKGGVMRFTQSLVLTRGIMQIQQDMDDPLSTHLTSQFGQCSQELMNLTLTGQAVSNVFDNILTLYDGSVRCRGISSQGHIGYLTQLEALRYCQVGSYFKSPQFPIWIIGSQSHFSVLFSTSYEPLQESSTQALLDKCRRAFLTIPNAEEDGFIPSASLGTILTALGVVDISHTATNTEENALQLIKESEIEKLVAQLEIPGSGIIIWDDFWRAISRLMTGVPLTRILQGEVSYADTRDVTTTNMISDNLEHTTPPMLTQYGEPHSFSFKTDEEIARELQSQYDQEMNISGNITNEPPESSLIHQSQNLPTSEDSFRLYYYNGLRGGNLSSFLVTQVDAHQAIGESVELVTSTSFGHGHSQNISTSTASSILENVIKTRWPNCKIDWCGKSPPNVD